MTAESPSANDRFIEMLLERDLGEARRERETITGEPGLESEIVRPEPATSSGSNAKLWIFLVILAATAALAWHQLSS